MRKIVASLVCVTLLAGCSQTTTVSTKTAEATATSEIIKTVAEVPAGFSQDYEEAEYEKFNSYASDNGLDGSLVWVDGIIDSINNVKDETTTYYSAIIADESGNQWLEFLDAESVILPNKLESAIENYKALVNHEARICGIYIGYSDVYKMPVMTTTKIFDKNDNSILLTCIGKTTEGSPEFDNEYIMQLGSYSLENSSTPVATVAATESSTPTPADKQTFEQKNALQSADLYLSVNAFSRQGMIDQLEFEGYSTESATYAADNCGADWNEQAAKSAQEYLNVTSFSKQGLIDQLIFEGFTQEQAEYGVKIVGY